MAEEIKVIHEIDLKGLEKFEKALKQVDTQGGIAKQVDELKKLLKLHDDKIAKEKESFGIIGQLLKRQKDLRTLQKTTQNAEALKRYNKELYEVGKQLKKNKDTTATWAKALGSFGFKFNALANIISKTIPAAMGAFNKAIQTAVNTVIEFEHAMAGVKAITGATDIEFKKLEKDAIRLGGATIFTARQVASLQMNYAKLGFSVTEIMNATEATLSLAAATDEDLANAALVAGSTLRAFNLDAIETQRVVDVMAKSFTTSALNLEHWRESMKFSAAIAQGTGLEIEALASAMAILADRGIKGSIAGTSMKNVLLRMGDATSGLSRKVGFAVNSSDSFIAALKELNEQGTSMTEVLQLTDRRAAPALKILIELSDEVEEYNEMVKKAKGASEEMANVRMDTLKGSITILKSAWEGFILSAERSTGVLTTSLRSIIDWTTKLVLAMKRLTLTHAEWINEWGSTEATDRIKELNRTLGDSEDKIGDVAKAMVEAEKELAAAEKALGKTAEELFTPPEDTIPTWKKMAKEVSVLTGRMRGGGFGKLPEEANRDARQAKKSSIILTEIERKAAEERLSIAAHYFEELKILYAELEIEAKLAGIDISLLLADNYAKELARLKDLDDNRKRDNQLAFELKKKNIRDSDALNSEKIKQEEEAADELARVNIESEIKMWEDLKQLGIDESEEITNTRIKLLKAQLANVGAATLKAETDNAEKILDLKKDIAKDEITIEFKKQKALANFIKDKTERDARLAELEKQYNISLLELDSEYLSLRKTLFESEGGRELEIDGIVTAIKLIDSTIAEIVSRPEDEDDKIYKGLADAAIKASNFVLDQIQSINDAEIRLNDERISRMDTHISELQRALNEEYALRREGKANRATQLEEEIRQEQEVRDKAYEQQVKLERKKRILNSLSQVSNLATAATDIFKAMSGIPVVGVPLAIGLIGTMLGAWVATLANIGDAVPKFAEGGWVDGDSHSRGGVMLNAEGGEFIMNKLAARDNADALEAMNNGDMWDKPIYKNIIKVDSKESENLLRELVTITKEKPNDYGGYIEYKRGNTIYRIKK